MTKQIFLLNGPASSGKDSLASFIVESNGTFAVEKFAYPLKLANKVLFSLTDEEFTDFDTNAELKNQPQDRFYGKSWREVNIDLSEKFIKDNYNINFFGRSLVSRIENSTKDRILVPDSGFLHEALPVVERFGRENVFLIKLVRPDHDFTGDSRGYLNGQDLGIQEYTLHNTNLLKYLEDGRRKIYNLIYNL